MDDYNFSWYILLVAILPALILLYLIWKRDKYQREPVWLIVLAFMAGTISVPLSFTVSIPTSLFWEKLFEDWIWTPITCLYDAFFEAAIPEELAKFAILFLFLRKNKYFDEYMDGIVYAAAISLGFAGLENIAYIASEEESWGAVALLRALLSVPGHFAYGVVMGYYYSFWRIENNKKCLYYAIALPILFHGAYDFILMFVSTTGYVTGTIIIAFFVGIHKLRKHCTELIDKHLEIDRRNFFSDEYATVNNAQQVIYPPEYHGFSGSIVESGITVDTGADLVNEPNPVNEIGFVKEAGFIGESKPLPETYREKETEYLAESKDQEVEAEAKMESQSKSDNSPE